MIIIKKNDTLDFAKIVISCLSSDYYAMGKRVIDLEKYIWNVFDNFYLGYMIFYNSLI